MPSRSARNHKSAILLWLGGGPPSIDMWDMKPGAPTGGPLKPISTTGDVQICEQLPLAGPADEASVDRPFDEHARGRPRSRPLLHAHGLRAEPERRAPELRFGHRPRDGRQGARAGDSAVRVDRRAERRARLFGHGLRAVSSRCQRPDSRRGHERAVAADGRPHEAAGRAGNAVHRRAPRHGGRGALRRCSAKRRTCSTSEQMEAFKVRSEPQDMLEKLRRQRLWPRLPDGPPAGRSRRAVRRSELRRLGFAPRLLHVAGNEAAGARQGIRCAR